MRQYLRSLLARAYRNLSPKPDHVQENKHLKQALNAMVAEQSQAATKAEAMERVSELIEARRMAGSGPWATSEAVLKDTDRLVNMALESLARPSEELSIRESSSPLSQMAGTYGDIDLMLSTVGWRRETNIAWLEFSRWGIQQIILISRLYYIKNPLIQRGINVAAYYVFGRGVEVSSPDEKANEVLKDFFERNKTTLGQIALTDLERRKYYDGNLFFVFFPDTQDKGIVNIRTIDATEIMDIVTDPNDTDKPQYYRRSWSERTFDPRTGSLSVTDRSAWYPAIGYDPDTKPQEINKQKVYWDNPILHRKCGSVAKWLFGCPLVYAALDWAKAARRFLEHCATVKQALAQIAMTLTTKGGQQAIAGMKQQLGTTVGPPLSAWDTNPTAVDGSIFASGPGTKLEAFKTSGAGGDPGEVKEFRNMVACVLGIPPTFLGDMETSNLATATSLDRPTELNFMEKQESWREDLCTIAKYVLKVSAGAPSGKLREAANGIKIEIREANLVERFGRKVMEAGKPTPGTIEVVVNFPAILEGDLQQEVAAVVTSMTLGMSQGVVGIDEKAGVRKLYDLVGIENGDELTEKQYPDSEYDPDRTKEPEPEQTPGAVKPTEAVKLARRLLEAVQVEKNGSAHVHTR